MNLPLMLAMFLPILVGVHRLYPWANPDRLLHDAILRHKAPYLNVGFWLVRTLIYFSIWIGLAVLMARGSRKFDANRSPLVAKRMHGLSAAGLVLYMLTVSLAGVDWIMSREPHYYSTIFGFILIVGQALSSLLVAVIVLSILIDREPLKSFVTKAHFNDLGNLMLTCVILWAYVAFSQYLITWTGNLQEEVKWYHLRSKGVYGFLAAVLIGLHFLTPFLMLLSKDLKRSPTMLARLAGALLVFRIIDIYWMVVPTGDPVASIHRFWLNLAAPLGIGGIWLSCFLWNLPRYSLLAKSEHEVPSARAEQSQDPESGKHGERHAHPA